ncbi:MAG: hypothetical protein ABIJ08_03070 [Nanoarchaeota archaeon]
MRTAPLKGSFMLTSIIGFIISWQYVLPRDKTWGFTFILFFTMMFIASVISMTTAPIDSVEGLGIVPPKKKKK